MKIGRTLPPAAATIGWVNIMAGVCAGLKGDDESERFKGELKKYFEQPYCFLVSSGKAALTLTLRALKEQHPDRDEVVIPAYACSALPAAISRAGLKVVLCDTNPNNFDFNSVKIRPLLKSKKLLCVVPIHMFGLPADICGLKAMIDDPEVAIVEDAAQAMGGEFQGSKLGTLGDVGFFSLGRGKSFTTVEGGIILTARKDLALRIQRQVEKLPGYSSFELLKLFTYSLAIKLLLNPFLFWLPKNLPFLKIGETVFDAHFKLQRMSSFQAGLSKNWVDTLQKSINIRLENSERWKKTLSERIFEVPMDRDRPLAVLTRFPVCVPELEQRRLILENGDESGSGISVVYPESLNKIDELRSDYEHENNFPAAEKYARELITLPIHQFVSTEDFNRIYGLLSK